MSIQDAQRIAELERQVKALEERDATQMRSIVEMQVRMESLEAALSARETLKVPKR
jgi:hypothetical protein